MHSSRVPRAAIGLAALVVLAGCGAFLGAGADAETTTESTTTLTPAPVLTGTATPTPTAEPEPEPESTPDPADDSPVTQPRYHALRPNCERPPGLVIHIQVAALANNDPATNAGINTTWRFAAPSNREATGPYSNFVGIITENYRPLLNSEEIAYGPLDRDDGVATRRVSVTAANLTTTYVWRVAEQSGGEYDGCWMTTGVRLAPRTAG